MTNKEFYNAILYLKAKYQNWNFDIQNEFLLKVWYEDFETIDYNLMIQLCKDYCKSNRFPPQSTYDLLNMIPKVYSENEAWERIVDIYQRFKTQEYFINQVLKEEPSLYPFVKGIDFYNVEKDKFGNSCLGYCIGRHFKRRYKEYLDTLKICYKSGELVQNAKLLLGE